MDDVSGTRSDAIMVAHLVDGDFQRMQNQQTLVKVVRDLSPYVTVDDGLGCPGDGLVAERPEKREEFRVPFRDAADRGTGTSDDGEQHLTMDEDALARLRSGLAHDTLDDVVRRGRSWG